VSRVANRVNELLVMSRGHVDSDEKRIVVRRLIEALEDRIGEGAGDDFSRLAWLYLHARDPKRAADIVRAGLSRDTDNFHLQNLKHRLEREGHWHHSIR